MTSQTKLARTPQFWIYSAVIPLIALAAGSLLPLLWKSSLPELLPTHWGTNGPDQFGSLASLIWPTLAIGAVLIVVLAAGITQLNRESLTQRICIVTNNFVAFMMGSIPAVTAFKARDLTETVDMSDPIALSMLFGLLGVGVGALLAYLLPKQETPTAQNLPTDGSPRVLLSESEAGIWVSREFSAAGVWIGILAAALTSVLAITTKNPAMLTLPALLIVAVTLLNVWDVRVDGTGVTTTALAKFVKRHIPLTEIEEASVTEVRAIKQYGGYGIRTGFNGSIAVILRSGEALQLSLSGNRTFVITMNNPDTAAGLVNTLVERSRQKS